MEAARKADAYSCQTALNLIEGMLIAMGSWQRADSVEGLPKPTQEDELQDNIFGLSSMEAYAGTMSNPETIIRARHKAVGFPAKKTVVRKGFIEKVIAENNRLLVGSRF
jgi:hypothetical protein